MHFSAKELTRLSEGTTSLGERLQGAWTATGGHDPAAARRLARWRQIAGADQPRQLAAMLRPVGRESMTDAELLALLGPLQRRADDPLPEWTRYLDRIVAGVGRTFADARPVFTRGGSSIPYEHLYWPIAAFAWNEVVDRYAPAGSLLAEKAQRALQRYLVRRIAHAASAAIHPIFLAHKSFEASAMRHFLFAALATDSSSSGTARFYASFVAEQGADGLRSLFTRLPVVARLVATVTRLWVDFVGEFLRRLEADQRELLTLLGDCHNSGQVCSVEAGISDPHHDGRSVLILGFHGGRRLVYKPRPLEIDYAFYRLVAEINERHPKPGLGVLNVLDRGEYGWGEFARHAPCSDRRAAKRYYRRAGSLACLVHWLRGIDFHRENVVAAGEHPILVDLECLAHPLRLDEAVAAGGDPESVLAYSVLRTGLLPMWQSRGAEGSPYDNCGLNGPVRRRSFLPLRRWEKINTDAMNWTEKAQWHHHAGHRPVLDRRRLTITSFEDDVLTGYREMTAVLESSGGAKLSAVRDEVFAATRRRIKRPTLVYGLVLRRSLEPAALVEGVDRSIELMALPYANDDPDWIEEVKSLEKLDVPYFRYPTGIKSPLPGINAAPTTSRLICQEQTLKAAVRRETWLEEGRIVLRAYRRSGARR